LLALRWLLAQENKRREIEPKDDTFEDVFVTVTDDEGRTDERRVDKVRHLISLLPSLVAER
jgi:MFS transporter, ACS family, allantoate permease